MIGKVIIREVVGSALDNQGEALSANTSDPLRGYRATVPTASPRDNDDPYLRIAYVRADSDGRITHEFNHMDAINALHLVMEWSDAEVAEWLHRRLRSRATTDEQIIAAGEAQSLVMRLSEIGDPDPPRDLNFLPPLPDTEGGQGEGESGGGLPEFWSRPPTPGSVPITRMDLAVGDTVIVNSPVHPVQIATIRKFQIVDSIPVSATVASVGDGWVDPFEVPICYLVKRATPSAEKAS